MRQLEMASGLVVDFTLCEGTRISGIVLGTSPGAVVIDLWDHRRRGSSSNPYALQLTEIESIVIP